METWSQEQADSDGRHAKRWAQAKMSEAEAGQCESRKHQAQAITRCRMQGQDEGHVTVATRSSSGQKDADHEGKTSGGR